MMKLIISICSLAFLLGSSGDGFKQYHSVESYEIKPGILITPVYSANQDICEISVERRHYSNNTVDMDALMSKEQIISIFDELVSREDRGGMYWKLPADTEVSLGDGGMVTTFIPYENVTLAMYGKKIVRKTDSQKYVAAIISWKKVQCNAK